MRISGLNQQNITNGKIKTNKKVAFSGYSTFADELGEKVFHFNFPKNSNAFKTFLEIFRVKKNGSGYYDIASELKNLNTGRELTEMPVDGLKLDMKKMFGLKSKEPFAYRYRLENKNNGKVFTAIDAGDNISYSTGAKFDKFSLVIQDGTNCNKGGAMKQVMPDVYNPGYVTVDNSLDDSKNIALDNKILERAQNSHRNMVNLVGGTIAGIRNDIKNIANEGYSRVLSLPLFGGDKLSSHGYWACNLMQVNKNFGNIHDYAALHRDLFKNGLNLVNDGAFVNESLEGIHYKDILEYGEDSPFFSWFRADSLKDGPLSNGIFSKNRKFIRHKLVNSPYSYKVKDNGEIVSFKNKDYDPEKETYFQAYDERLASDAQKKDNKNLIKIYDNTNTDNLFEINTHNDTVVNYAFKIKPETYKKNIQDLNEYNRTHANKIDKDSARGAMFLSKGENYKCDDKFESGIETWEANTDILKINYIMSNSDMKRLQRYAEPQRSIEMKKMLQANYEAQDYALSSGIYQTKMVKNIITEYAAQSLSHLPKDSKEALNVINGLIEKGVLPNTLKDKIDENVIKNIFDGKYKLSISNHTPSYKENMLSGIMSLPLDSIEFGDSISSVMAYPYITNRATTQETLGKSRYFLYKHDNPHLTDKYKSVYNKTTKMFTGELADFANEIYSKINSGLPEGNKLFNGDNATDLGKYVLPMYGQDVAKFAIIKSLCPDIACKVRSNGEIVYDYEKLDSKTLKAIGVSGCSPEEVASNMISRIKSGIKHISDKDKEVLEKSLKARLNGVDENSYKLADAIVDRTNSGLDWRIDAAKDIADMSAQYNNYSSHADIEADLQKFWKKFSNGVLSKNPNSYIVAEYTNFPSNNIVRNSGMTSTVNYENISASNLNKTVGKAFEADNNNFNNYDGKFYNMLVEENGGYLSSKQLKSLLYSYTFSGNHDKPRALHCFALDMDTFFTDFARTKDERQLKKAISILKNEIKDFSDEEVKNFRFDTVSGQAIAMGESMRTHMHQAIDKLNITPEQKNQLKEQAGKAIANMAAGKYKDTAFAPDAFGTKPFDETIDSILQEIEFEQGKPLDKDVKKDIYSKTLELTLKPAMSRLKAIHKFLVALPGNPTLFAGDDIGLTGYDNKCKNTYLQCRGVMHREWLDEKNEKFLKFIQDYKKETDDIIRTRSDKNLEPLNTGAPFALEKQCMSEEDKKPVSAILRQNSNGAMTISLINTTSHIDPWYEKEIAPTNKELEKIDLSNSISRSSNTQLDDGIRAGLTPGKVFYDSKKHNEKYIVQDDGHNGHTIKKCGGGNIILDDWTKILYSEPETKAQPSFSGRGKKVLYNPQYNFVTNPYAKKSNKKLGENLSLSK